MRGVVILTAWCALLAGLVEVLMLVRALRLSRILRISRDFPLIVPAGDLVLFAALAALILLVALAWPRFANTGVVAGIGVALIVLTFLTYFRLHWGAMLLLAAGAGVSLGQLAAAHEARVLRFAGRTLPLLALVMVVAAAGWRILTSRRDAAHLKTLGTVGTAPAGAPNVLVLVLDAVRPRNLGLYGYERRTTPHLDSFALASAVFERAFSTASYTLPSHASLFTGRWPHQLRVNWKSSLERGVPTLAAELRRRGYRTAGFSANQIYVTWEHGLLRDFEHRSDYDVRARTVFGHAGVIRWLGTFDPLLGLLRLHDAALRRNADQMTGTLLRWIDGGDRERPFFAFVNLYDAHTPYLAGAPYDTMFGPPATSAERRRVKRISMGDFDDLSAEDVARQLDQYDAALARLDAALGRLFRDLDSRGILRNTLVIVTADHGEAFGEHGRYQHGNDINVESIEIPLLFTLPGRVPPARLSGVASLRDVPATVGAILGATDWPLPGRPLTRHWSAPGGAVLHDTVLVEIDSLPSGAPPGHPVIRGANRSLIAWPYRLIRIGPDVELFDLAADPGERVNLAGRPEQAGTRDSLIAALQRWRADAVAGKR